MLKLKMISIRNVQKRLDDTLVEYELLNNGRNNDEFALHAYCFTVEIRNKKGEILNDRSGTPSFLGVSYKDIIVLRPGQKNSITDNLQGQLLNNFQKGEHFVCVYYENPINYRVDSKSLIEINKKYPNIWKYRRIKSDSLKFII